MNRQIVELLEYQPKLLPYKELSEDLAKILWQNYIGKLDIQCSFQTNNQWKLTSLGYVGFIPVSSELGLALRPKVGLAN